jgi:hypothetical protein
VCSSSQPSWHHWQVPRISFGRTELSVFSFVDVDTPEAHAFTTYLAYWEAFATIVEGLYPEPARLLDDLKGRKKFRSLSSSQFAGDTARLQELLLNSWHHELGLHMVDEDDPRVAAYNQQVLVSAYYAISHSARAWLLTHSNSQPTNHRHALSALAAMLHESRLFPSPWNFTCTRIGNAAQWSGLPKDPSVVSNLASNYDCYDMVAKALRTTRGKRVKELVDIQKAALKVKRAPNGLLRTVDQGAEPTTVFDVLWRSRTRSSYGNPSMFYVGTLDPFRARSMLRSVKTVVEATMLLFEACVAQRSRESIAASAVHYMSRDKTGITDQTLLPRMRALGLV